MNTTGSRHARSRHRAMGLSIVELLVAVAVGLILDGPQAEQVLQDGHADLIAIGRQALYDSFWPLHAAESLGCDPAYAMWAEEYGWWLEKRLHSLVRTAAT